MFVFKDYLCTKIYSLDSFSGDKLATSVEDDSNGKINTHPDRPKGILLSYSCKNNGTSENNKFIKKYSMFKVLRYYK